MNNKSALLFNKEISIDYVANVKIKVQKMQRLTFKAENNNNKSNIQVLHFSAPHIVEQEDEFARFFYSNEINKINVREEDLAKHIGDKYGVVIKYIGYGGGVLEIKFENFNDYDKEIEVTFQLLDDLNKNAMIRNAKLDNIENTIKIEFV